MKPLKNSPSTQSTAPSRNTPNNQTLSNPPSKRKPWQRYLAELIGTFAVVFVASGAAITNFHTQGSLGLLGNALASGLIVSVMIFALGPISAAHFNPAVTLGFASAGRFPWQHVPGYLLAEFGGALLASALNLWLFGRDVAIGAKMGATLPTVSWASAIGFELIFSFFLMFVIIAVATDRRVPGTTPALAIGFTVILDILMGGPLTGASMNPARSLAPALFAGGLALRTLWLYLVAPTVGAILAALLYEQLRDGESYTQSAPEGLDS